MSGVVPPISAPPAGRTPAARMIVIGALAVMLAMGVRATFGLFMQPIGLENGWGRDVFSMAFAIQNLTWGIGAIAAGMLADRFGAGRTIAGAALLYALGLVLMRFAGSEVQLYLSAGVLVGLGQAGTTFPVILPVIARVVPLSQRSTALGIVSAGGSLGQFLIVPSGQFLIDALQWSGALFTLSMMVALILPMATQLTGKPAQEGAGGLSMWGAIRQAVRHPSYHFLFWSYAVCGFHTAFITLHLPSYVVDQGLNAGQGATALALIGLFNVFGSLWAGKMGGRYSKRLLLAGLYAVRGVAIGVLLLVPLTPVVLYAFAAVMGLVWLGTVPLTIGLVGQIYGMRYAATLSGVVFLGHQVGSFVGVWMGGKLYVATGSYTVVWLLGLGLAFAAAALCLPVRERPLAQPA
jgi:predicted MFS family arabinose efflux permease